MLRFFSTMIWLIWAFDVINIPKLEFLDTTFPINALGWLLVLAIIEWKCGQQINELGE